MNSVYYLIFHCQLLASLQIINAEEADQGHYECVAENKIGTAYSDPAALYVRSKENIVSIYIIKPNLSFIARVVPPYFSIPPEPVYEIMPGSSINLTCVAVSMLYLFI